MGIKNLKRNRGIIYPATLKLTVVNTDLQQLHVHYKHRRNFK